jgi:hypothetical protein
MSILLSGPRLSHCDCQALGLAPPAFAAACMLAANLLLAEDADDTGGLELPWAISLMRSRGFFSPLALLPALLLLPILRLLTEVGGWGGIPYCNRVNASGVRLPEAKRGCKNGQAPRAADSFSFSLPNLGILGPPGLKLSGNPGLLLWPDKSRGDSASLEGDLAGAEAADRLRTPANAAAEAACEAADNECSSRADSSCLRFRT